jgi:hypothetical protein
MNLTPNFTLEEMTSSETATRHGIANTPNPKQITALKALCENVLEPLRARLGTPIHVTSGYRNPIVNSLIHGSDSSQHMKGEAADIKVSGMNAQQLFDFILASNIPFDQIIQEYNKWVHISYSVRRQRRSILYAVKNSDGSTSFKKKSPFNL